MAKNIISEERLNTIIKEIIEESLQDEGLGTKIAQGLGTARQWVQNKVNNYTNAFNAGRNRQRYANRDYDPYQGMQNANQYRNFNNDEYGQYRYNVTADRNNRAKQSWSNQYGTQTQRRPSDDGERAANYFAGRQGQQGNQSVPQQNPDTQQNQNSQQNPNTQQNRQQVVNKAQQQLQQKSNFLKQKGFQLVNGQWLYTKDGSNSPALQSQYPDIVQAAKAYNIALKGVKGVYETKLQNLKKQLNEIKTSVNNKKAGK